MSTRDKIVSLGLELIQIKGINGFSFADIAKVINIKKASIHYYFPSKHDLIEAVLEKYSIDFFEALKASTASTLKEKLEYYIFLYRANLTEGRICLCTDLAMDTNNLSSDINAKVGSFFEKNLDWLQEQFSEDSEQKLASEFFASLQGAQLIARNQKSINYFDMVTANSIERILVTLNKN